MKLEVIIGLEFHVQLKTKTKMFCACSNETESKEPNKNICPICLGHPGVLPTINAEAVKMAIKAGRALNCTISKFTKFDRKHYFYPDLPKGYQISQYDKPIAENGYLVINSQARDGLSGRLDDEKQMKRIKIIRLHMEEDSAKSTHQKDSSLIDYNRGGTPLVELVTAPHLSSPQEAKTFAQEIQLIMRHLGISSANMENGQLRCDANISMRPTGDINLYPKSEIKNINSFRSIERALAFEIERQTILWKAGLPPSKEETRGWDENKGATFSQRIKEGSDDYRYFPDPDLPKLKISEISEFSEEELKKEIPELPKEKRERYSKNYGIKDEDIESYILNRDLAELFETVVSNFSDKEIIKLASNYLTSDLIGLVKNNIEVEGLGKIEEKNFVELISLVKEDKISSRGAKDILTIMYKEGGMAKEIAKEKNLFQQSDEGELQKIIDQVIIENSSVVEEYKNGKETVLGFLVGQAMKISGGSGNPQKLSELFKKRL